MTEFTSLFKIFLEKYGLKSIIAISLTGVVYFFWGINNILELFFIFSGFVLLVCILDNAFSFVFKQLKKYKEEYHYTAEEKHAIDELFYIMPEKAKFNALQLMELPTIANTKYHLSMTDKIEQDLYENDFNPADYYVSTSLKEGPCIDYKRIGNQYVIYVHPHLYKLLKKEKKNRHRNKQ